jgi:hypothetical protein
MVLVLALLLVLILFGAGFALHVLWIAAAIFLVVWLIGLEPDPLSRTGWLL